MKSFNNGNSEWDSRSISIKIDNETICFYFDKTIKQFYARKSYLEEHGYEPEDGEETEPSYFYWIDIVDWKNPQRNWSNHMAEKSWFTNEMENYINQQTQ
jgi:hypothetical protein